MFKKIMFTGVLLISISVLKAKNITPLGASIPTTIHNNIDEGLANKLAADNDFKNYYISNVKFANKIIETKAGGLFLKYIKNTIVADEQTILFAKMNVNGKKEFDEIAVNLKNEAVLFFNKFPELKLLPEKEQKELLVNAFRKLSTDKSISVKFVNAKLITMEQCFWIWMGCNTLCFIGCSYSETNACYWECAGFCAAEYSLCWFTAE
ncbi:MAG: hypothetical protein ACKVOM_06105 [Ferruginibacter sp.]